MEPGATRTLDELAAASPALFDPEDLEPESVARDAGRAAAEQGGEGMRPFTGEPTPEALLAHVGFAEFRPGQREAVAAALAGRDALIVMPTGGGKSLCYQLPGLASADLTIVVSPLIALMRDQVGKLRAAGHPAVMLASGLSQEEAGDSLRRIRDGSARIVYCAPERFGSTSFLNAVDQRRVDLMAVDEAHCLSEWGHDFRPDYLRLPRALDRLGRPPVIACTATATEEVADEIRRRLGMVEPLSVRAGFDRPNLSFDTVTFAGAGSKARKLALLTEMLGRDEMRPAIVYCGTRKDTVEVAERLRETGIDAAGYHAGMEPEQRVSIQERFMGGALDVVTATNAFGMGVDKADVRSVWHWALPTSVEAYYQEAGRAGRDGAPARAVLLAMRADLGRLIQFIKQRQVDPDAVIAYIHALHARAEGAPSLVIDNPRDDRERVRLAVAERAGALRVEPAPAGRLEITLDGEILPAKLAAACRVAHDRGWRAYRAIEAYAFGAGCRRRALLDHFGDASAGRPRGRCCDVCDPDTGLPDPAALEAAARAARRGARGRSASAAGGAGAAGRSAGGGPSVPPESELAPADVALFDRLKQWRLVAANGKPAYTVANNATLAAIAVRRPASAEALADLRGVGPAFLKRYAEAVLELVAAAD